MGEIKEVPCPFCGKIIEPYIGDKCGSEPKGSVSVHHTCESGLFIEWFEEVQDIKEVIRALQCRAK